MADNYLQFSFSVMCTKKEGEWFKRFWSELSDHVYSERRGSALEPPPTPLIKEFISMEPELKDPDNMDCSSLDVSVSQEGLLYFLWFHSDEGAGPYFTAQVVRFFLHKCRPGKNDYVGFTWAETCSKMRLDQFGGGACFITKDKVEEFSAWGWLEDKLCAHGKKHSKKGGEKHGTGKSSK